MRTSTPEEERFWWNAPTWLKDRVEKLEREIEDWRKECQFKEDERVAALLHARGLNDYSAQSHEDNIKWWQDLSTGDWLDRNKGELIALMHSELSEALEGVRKDLMDDKLPHRTMEEVELADLLIRVFDYAGAYGLDLEGAYQEKREYNAQREDHTHEARRADNGKRF